MKIKIDPKAVDKIIREGLLALGMFNNDLLDNSMIKVYQTGNHKLGISIDLEGKKNEKK